MPVKNKQGNDYVSVHLLAAEAIGGDVNTVWTAYNLAQSLVFMRLKTYSRVPNRHSKFAQQIQEVYDFVEAFGMNTMGQI